MNYLPAPIPGPVETESRTVRLNPVRAHSMRTLHGDLYVPSGQREGRYFYAFATSPKAIEAAQRLRYEVFNVELGEGLATSALQGLDEDEFDGQMTHLLLLHGSTQEIVGTYRLQTVEHALRQGGLYSTQEFDIDFLDRLEGGAIECGRACLHSEHRNVSALLTLWMGIAEFMKSTESRYLFGCCSITSTDPDDGWRALNTIRAKDFLHTDFFVEARPEFSCGLASRASDPNLGTLEKLPKLFGTYMKLGARVVSEPAIDHSFGTVDFLVLMDSGDVTHSSFTRMLQA